MATGAGDRIMAEIESAGGVSALVAGMEAFRKNTCDLDDRMEELTARYPNHWVALLDGEVLTHPGSQIDLLKLVDRHGWNRDVTAIEYLDPNPAKLIL